MASACWSSPAMAYRRRASSRASASSWAPPDFSSGGRIKSWSTCTASDWFWLSFDNISARDRALDAKILWAILWLAGDLGERGQFQAVYGRLYRRFLMDIIRLRDGR